MKIVLQRVQRSQVSVNQKIVGQINRGLTLLVGVAPTDTEAELQWLARKCLELRLFPDTAGNPWRCSIQEIQGEILVVSQFTLYGDCRKGRRPSFSDSARPEQAEQIYEKFVDLLRQSGLKIETGKFGAMMQVEIINDGPVTLILEREAPSI
ncbi:MAG: D-aminoacyl-tRNA deacylase [Synechococcus sp.]|nr:D-aminoacyl-tRNA deacylase [Synechococcus sp.]